MKPKRYIVWSKEEIDLDDPFQRKWYMTQVLLHGRAEDLASLDLDELARLLPELDLPEHIRSLWEDVLKEKGYIGGPGDPPIVGKGIL